MKTILLVQQHLKTRKVQITLKMITSMASEPELAKEWPSHSKPAGKMHRTNLASLFHPIDPQDV